MAALQIKQQMSQEAGNQMTDVVISYNDGSTAFMDDT